MLISYIQYKRDLPVNVLFHMCVERIVSELISHCIITNHGYLSRKMYLVTNPLKVVEEKSNSRHKQPS